MELQIGGRITGFATRNLAGSRFFPGSDSAAPDFGYDDMFAIALLPKMKYLLLIAFVGVVWWVFRNRSQRPIERKRASADPETMVVCAYCGVHLPQSESVFGDDGVYCSEAHRQTTKESRKP